jgi:flagellar motor switch protein FliG
MPDPKEKTLKIDGKKEASELLRSLDAGMRERILTGIAARDPVLAETLKKGMVTFFHLLQLPAVSFQIILRSLPQTTVAKAARGMTGEEEALFFSLVSGRQGMAIREERDSIGPQKKSDVEAARQALIEKARELHARGEIDLDHQPRI